MCVHAGLCELRVQTLRTKELVHCLLLFSGPLLGYPLQGVSTLIQSVNMEPGTSPAMVSACVSRCMLKVKQGLPVLTNDTTVNYRG